MSNTLLTSTDQPVRVLMSRTWIYVVPTAIFTGYLGHRIALEQHERSIADIVRWALATYNVTPMSGGAAPLSAEAIGNEVARHARKNAGDKPLLLLEAVNAVGKALAPVYGHQLRITGWLPGQRVGDGHAALTLSGSPCPECTVNPMAFLTGAADSALRCLNSDDCGWSE